MKYTSYLAKVKLKHARPGIRGRKAAHSKAVGDGLAELTKRIPTLA